jgi:hypothetical protein
LIFADEEVKPKEEEPVQEPWIVQGLANLVQKIPRRPTTHAVDDGDGGSELKSGESHPDLTEREKDYREWLAESEQLHHGALFNLAAEIETEDEDEDRNGGVRTPGKLL